MKIDNSAKTISSAQGSTGPRAAGVRPAATGASTGSPAAGQSTTVVSMALHSVNSSEATFDSQKVAEIRQAISEGRFQINSGQIADGLISSVREMLNQNRRPV